MINITKKKNTGLLLGKLKPGFEIRFFLLFFFIFWVLFPNLSLNWEKYPSWSSQHENLFDYIRIQYSIESIFSGYIPFWNPFTDNGHPYYIYQLISGFLTPLDFLFAGAWHIVGYFYDFVTKNALRYIPLFYGAILTMGFYKFLSSYFNTKNAKIINISLSLIAVFIIFKKASWGYNFVYYMMNIFPMFAFYYLNKLLMKKTDGLTFMKFGFCYGLTFYLAGTHAVVYSIIILNLVVFTIFSPLRYHPFHRFSYAMDRSRLSVILFILTPILSLAIVSPFLYATKFTVPLFERYGRSIGNFSYTDFLDLQLWGKTLYKFTEYFIFQADPASTSEYAKGDIFHFTPFLLVFFAILAILNIKHVRNTIPFFFLSLFLLTLIQERDSLFLAVFYKYLFPWAIKSGYTGSYYDFIFIPFILYASLGFKEFFSQQKLFIEALALFAYVLAYYFLGAWLKIPFILFSSSLTILLVLAFLRKYVSPQQMGSFVAVILLFWCMWDITPVQTIGDVLKQTGDQTEIVNRRISKVKKWDYPEMRSFIPEREKVNWADIGIPQAKREVSYQPNLRYFSLKSQLALDSRINLLQRKKYYALDSPLLRITGNVVFVNKNDTLEELVKGRLDDHIETTSIELDKNVNGKVEVIEFEPNRLLVKVTSSGRAFLIWSDAWHPGWKAWINGESSIVYKANHHFKAIELPKAGNHVIEFRFLPVFRYFYYLSLLAVVTCSVLILFLTPGTFCRKWLTKNGWLS
jgi:hypothetical protein